jgi:hypothetical protein
MNFGPVALLTYRLSNKAAVFGFPVILDTCSVSQDTGVPGRRGTGPLLGSLPSCFFAFVAFRGRMLARLCFLKNPIAMMAPSPELDTRLYT